jgi:predicted O-linked N-acetylglucosamine transferase (SPINDLY family)/2-polyprenyl-3-methyl-5-hydroxy-6-metoxy-1,4-benzoquinol methylase
MKSLDKQLQQLLLHINSGQAAETLPKIESLLKKHPTHLGLMTLKAESLRLIGQTDAAIQTFTQSAELGAGERNWLSAGVLLATQRRVDEALACFDKAFKFNPKSTELLDAYTTTLFNAGRQYEGIDFARRQLEICEQPLFLINAALLLQSCDLYEESTQAFKKIHAFLPHDHSVLGSALVAARFTCDWEWIGYLQQKIKACYAQGDFDSPQEFPLTHLTWCNDEATNLAVTRAYVRRMVNAHTIVAHPKTSTRGSRIRVGYLSCDFRNHATMHLMAGLLQAHDAQRFEIFAYDYTVADNSEYRQRFLSAIEHHRDIQHMDDVQAAQIIADDALDLLIDLKVYTGGGRPAILSQRPARLQAAYLGYPGSAACEDIDYIISDRFVTPDSSAPYYSEKFCRLPHSYQCNDTQRFSPSPSARREDHNLPDDKIIFAAFNQSYKIDPDSFGVWLDILRQVDNSVLWLLGQSEAAKTHLSAHAQKHGIAQDRIVFAPFAAPHEHLTRLQLADAVLDTLICNGHTTTSDALWVGVPVITCRGHHFASRVSESLLNAIELPELVAQDKPHMIALAKRFANDSAYRNDVRARLQANKLSAPLFDTLRFTRNFERAIEMMVELSHQGSAPHNIDVPDTPIDSQTGSQISPPLDTQAAVEQPLAQATAQLQSAFAGCPLCQQPSQPWISIACTSNAAYAPDLPAALDWLKCSACGHVHTSHFWTDTGLQRISPRHEVAPLQVALQEHEIKRHAWQSLIQRALVHLGGYAHAMKSQPAWLDLGCGDGSLIMSAADHGFAVSGIDCDAQATLHLQNLGYEAHTHNIAQFHTDQRYHVVSLINVLQLLRDPRQLLENAHQWLDPKGLLMLSVPDMHSSTWRILDAAAKNPFWSELTHLHNFTRTSLLRLLHQCGYEVCNVATSQRYTAHLEVVAQPKQH